MTEKDEKLQSNPVFVLKTANQNLLVIMLVISSFLVGSLSTEVRYLKAGTSPASPKPANVIDKQQAINLKITPTPPLQNTPGAENILPLQENDHIRGSRTARIIMIIYSDLECPFCKIFHTTTKQILEEYKDNLALVYRHFPLDIHPKARKEAEAVECAGKLGSTILGGMIIPESDKKTETDEPDKFWGLVDKIYEVTPSNNGLNLNDLPGLAGQVGIDTIKFKQCLDSGEFSQLIEDDYQSGIKAGVSATPSSFIIDTKTGKTKTITGAVQADQIKSVIDSMLKE